MNTETELRIEALRKGRDQWGCEGYSPLGVGQMFDTLGDCKIKNAVLQTGNVRMECGGGVEIMGTLKPAEPLMVTFPGSIHYHDAFCALPVPLEVALAGVQEPVGGWRSRG